MTIPLPEVPEGVVFRACEPNWVCRCQRLVRIGNSVKTLAGNASCRSTIHMPEIVLRATHAPVEVDPLALELLEVDAL